MRASWRRSYEGRLFEFGRSCDGDALSSLGLTDLYSAELIKYAVDNLHAGLTCRLSGVMEVATTARTALNGHNQYNSTW